MHTDLGKLVELQQTDTNLRRLKNLIDSAELRRTEIEQEFEKQASAIREIQTRHQDLKTQRSSLEKQIADNKTYLERADRNLKHAQNQKEYETAMRETDALQKANTGFENQILELEGSIEGVESELSDRSEEIATLDSKRDEALAEFQAALDVDVREYESEKAHRDTAFSALSDRFASVHNRLVQRSKDGIAVAEVKNGTCSACFIALRPQVQLEVKRGDQIVVCENCSRILYVMPKESEATA